MARAMTTFCDRCGKPVEESPSNTLKRLMRFDKDYHGTQVDLCIGCGKMLKEWLENPESPPPGYERIKRPCPHRVPCADPEGCSGYILVPV